MSKHSQTEMNIAHDSFITVKKQTELASSLIPLKIMLTP